MSINYSAFSSDQTLHNSKIMKEINWSEVVKEHMRKREEEMWELGDAYEYPEEEED